MASLQRRNGSYRILFCHHGKLHSFTIGKVKKAEAEVKARQVDYLLMRLKQGLLLLPTGTDIVSFIEHDGNPPEAGPTLASAPRQVITIGLLRDRYLLTHGNGTIETNSLDTCKLHLGHFCRMLGEGTPVAEVSLVNLQEYVNKRARAKLSPVTIRKEIATFRAAWNWGEPMGLTAGKFPNRGLRYPKADEKPPFMTMAEIDRRLAKGGDPDMLWEALYLQASELAELLAHVNKNASYPWIYPLVCFAAHTGARRSEMLRALVTDVDFTENTVLVRERKRSRGERTTRRVPLTSFLKEVLSEWLRVHPGGPALFCHAGTVVRSKKRSSTTGHLNENERPSSLKGRMATVKKREQAAQTALTRSEVHDHFKRVLIGTKWEKMRGLRTLRHSFVSACASKGVDQRLVEEWAGHLNEATSKRYRHLYPSTQQEAITQVFG
jgi:integrase